MEVVEFRVMNACLWSADFYKRPHFTYYMRKYYDYEKKNWSPAFQCGFWYAICKYTCAPR
jgi:hypothetical protein